MDLGLSHLMSPPIPDGASPAPRFESTLLPGKIRLAIQPTRKLKTVLVKVFITDGLDEQTTERSLISQVLGRGTRQLPDMQQLNRFLEGLYGTRMFSSVAKSGEWHVSRYGISVVNESFVPGEKRLLGRGLEFLGGLVGSPHTENGVFSSEYVDSERAILAQVIESLVDDKSSYAHFRCVEEMCSREPFRRYSQGDVARLQGVDAASLWTYYREWIRSAPIAIYVSGDVDPARVRDEIEAAFSFERGEVREPLPVAEARPVEREREVREQLDLQQARLVIGYRHGITYAHPDYESLVLMNGVLGGYSHSKLFQNVREKASLAYSAYSSVERHKGLLFVSCGIAAEKYEQALRISLEQVDAMAQGDISDEDIEATRKTVLEQNRMLEDDFSALAEADFALSLHGRRLDMPGFRERIRAVDKADMVRVAQRLRRDTTYFLHGADDGASGTSVRAGEVPRSGETEART